MQDINNITSHFKGHFITTPDEMSKRLSNIKAFVFDWDGVFNAGWKDAEGSSAFNEVDAMGTNLLRFNHYLRSGRPPFSAVITGEKNKAALHFATREHFNGVYCNVKYKRQALDHMCETCGIKPEEVCFMFDDVLDFSISAVAGLRIMVGRECNPLMIEWAVNKGYVDYLTAATGAEYAVREMVELLTGISGKYTETIDERARFTDTYKTYLKARNEADVKLYVAEGEQITEKKSL